MAALEVGQRVFSHYTMKWGTVERVAVPRERVLSRGEPTEDFTTWWVIANDEGGTDILDDYDGVWDLARVFPAHIATRYGYGPDPLAEGQAAAGRSQS